MPLLFHLWYTLKAPSHLSRDAGELTAATVTLTHSPTASPLFLLLYHALFRLLPHLSTASVLTRLNTVHALVSAATSSLLSLLSERVLFLEAPNPGQYRLLSSFLTTVRLSSPLHHSLFLGRHIILVEFGGVGGNQAGGHTCSLPLLPHSLLLFSHVLVRLQLSAFNSILVEESAPQN